MTEQDIFLGKWKTVSLEGYAPFIKALGISGAKKKLATANSKVTLEFRKGEQDLWRQRVKVTLRKADVTFRMGEEFEEETIDERKVKTRFCYENGFLKQTQTQLGQNTVVVIRRILENGQMEETITMENDDTVDCKRIYKRVN